MPDWVPVPDGRERPSLQGRARVEHEFHFQYGRWYPEAAGGCLAISPRLNEASMVPPATKEPMLQKRIDDQPSISAEMVREAQGILHQHLKRVGLKQTAQRDTILRTFLETREHLSTDQLLRLVKKKDA